MSKETAKKLRGKPIQPGSTVFAKIGEALKLNRRAYIYSPCLVDNNVMAVKAIDSLLDRYVYLFLMATDFSEASRATTVPSLRKGDVESLELPLPPLPEQKRITDKLDTLLARVDSCQSHLERVPEILKRFRQSLLDAATSGRLTEEWEDIERVEYLSLSEVIKRIKTGPFGSALHKSEYITDGIPFVNPMHINNGRITPRSEMTISEEKARELQDFLLTRDDVVLARRGVMGRCAVVGEKEEGWLCGSGSMILHPTERLLPEYLQIFLSSPETVSNLESDSVGSTMSNLNQKILLELTIRLPGISEQQEIVRQVERLNDFADRLEARWQAGQDLVKQLTPSLLAKAFRGELVEQDPEDESAAVLLERIKAERSVLKKLQKGMARR